MTYLGDLMGKRKFKVGDMAGPGRDCELGEPCTLTDGELLAPKIPTALLCLPALRFAQMSSLLKMSHNGCRMIACEKSEWIISGPN